VTESARAASGPREPLFAEASDGSVRGGIRVCTSVVALQRTCDNVDCAVAGI
jgi:hypothetical protein